MSTAPFKPEPEASALVLGLLDECRRRLPGVRLYAERLLAVGARLADAVDLVSVHADGELRRELAERGFAAVPHPDGAASGRELFEHPGALLPLVELRRDDALRIYARVDSLVDFLEAAPVTVLGAVEGAPSALVRRVLVDRGDGAELWVAERRAERTLVAARDAGGGPGSAAIERHLEAFRLRPRPLDDPAAGFEVALELARAARAELGDALACEVFFDAERRFYARKNHAARVQKARQDALGLGWFNRDHHTYRSSRRFFGALVRVLEALGLRCRERFYAGRDAGWGAQVMDHPATGLCVFADVDLTPEEIAGDFAHEALESRPEVGTVGLWCELHGEAFLAAGMHHLECQFDIEAVSAALRAAGVGVMPRFSDFTHLKQAFTQGEVWRVGAERLARAEREGFVSEEQAARLAREGALGSHFEVLERNAGYKGFNQEGINRIILATDPRRAEADPRAAAANRLTSHG
ncbi:MAG TPA: hypothetical protein VMI54_29375 [Polyangiaceae bacterium]|nr:hypothetical protein [Polyangiaceae bacterium]